MRQSLSMTVAVTGHVFDKSSKRRSLNVDIKRWPEKMCSAYTCPRAPYLYAAACMHTKAWWQLSAFKWIYLPTRGTHTYKMHIKSVPMCLQWHKLSAFKWIYLPTRGTHAYKSVMMCLRTSWATQQINLHTLATQAMRALRCAYTQAERTRLEKSRAARNET